MSWETGQDGRRSRSVISPLVVLCVAQFVLQLDFSIVNVALKTIRADLHFSPAGLQWVVTSYALTFGALLLLGGRLGGRARAAAPAHRGAVGFRGGLAGRRAGAIPDDAHRRSIRPGCGRRPSRADRPWRS